MPIQGEAMHQRYNPPTGRVKKHHSIVSLVSPKVMVVLFARTPGASGLISM